MEQRSFGVVPSTPALWPVPKPQRQVHFEFGGGRYGGLGNTTMTSIRGVSAMSNLTARSYDFDSLKTAKDAMRIGLRHSYDFHPTSPARPTARVHSEPLPPIGFALSSRPPASAQLVDKDGFDFWKQHQRPLKRSAFFVPEPGAEVPPRTTFDMTFTHRQTSPKNRHSMNNPKPLPVARQILPDDPKSASDRLLPSVDREKMTKLPTKFGRSKKILEPNQKPAGIFYSEGEVEDSKNDKKYWGSLHSLWGKDFSRKRDIAPTQPTELSVAYFNGGAPGSPKRKSRRTNMAHLRGDSSRVDFNNSLYGKDEADNEQNYL